MWMISNTVEWNLQVGIDACSGMVCSQTVVEWSLPNGAGVEMQCNCTGCVGEWQHGGAKMVGVSGAGNEKRQGAGLPSGGQRVASGYQTGRAISERALFVWSELLYGDIGDS